MKRLGVLSDKVLREIILVRQANGQVFIIRWPVICAEDKIPDAERNPVVETVWFIGGQISDMMPKVHLRAV